MKGAIGDKEEYRKGRIGRIAKLQDWLETFGEELDDKEPLKILQGITLKQLADSLLEESGSFRKELKRTLAKKQKNEKIILTFQKKLQKRANELHAYLSIKVYISTISTRAGVLPPVTHQSQPSRLPKLSSCSSPASLEIG